MASENRTLGNRRASLRHMRIATCICLLASFAQAADLSVAAMRTAKGFTWTTRNSPNFDFFVESGTYAERNLDRVVAIMESSRAHVEDLLGAKSPHRDTVFVVDSRARMKALTGLESNAFATGDRSFAVFNETLNALGSHETCHNLALALWGRSKGEWINEGLAVYSDDQWRGQPLHAVARSLLDQRKLIPLGKLMKDGWQKKYSDMITYPEVGSFVKFLYETHGREAVKTIWERGAKNIEELEILWHANLGTVDASGIQYKP